MILFCMPECSANQLKSFSIALWQYFWKWNMVTVKQSFTHTLGTSLPLLYNLNSAEVSQTKLQLTFSTVPMSQPITWLHNCVTTFAVTSLCSDITGELIPGSPPPFWYFVGMRGEPGNEARLFLIQCVSLFVRQFSRSFWSHAYTAGAIEFVYVFCGQRWLSLSLCQRFSGEINRLVLVCYCPFALTILFV